MVSRTKRLTLNRAKEILQLRYGSQVQTVRKFDTIYIADSILCEVQGFSRGAILAIEDELYSGFGV
jgi:hypothetical protein